MRVFTVLEFLFFTTCGSFPHRTSWASMILVGASGNDRTVAHVPMVDCEVDVFLFQLRFSNQVCEDQIKSHQVVSVGKRSSFGCSPTKKNRSFESHLYVLEHNCNQLSFCHLHERCFLDVKVNIQVQLCCILETQAFKWPCNCVQGQFIQIPQENWKPISDQQLHISYSWKGCWNSAHCTPSTQHAKRCIL